MDKKPILYVDMDDTICNYKLIHSIKLEKNPEIKFPQSQYGFFLFLPPIDDAIWFLNILKENYDIWILTRPSVQNPLCYTEKRVWVEKHLGMEWCHKLIISPDKALLKGDLLIDDVLWENFEGEQIQYGKGEFTSWRKVYFYLMKRLKQQ